MKKQKVWYITGASSGFGLEITKAALENGDKVVATVRKAPEKLEESLNYHPDLLVVTMDVTDESGVNEAVKQAIDHFGRIDVLVNNAGYGFMGAIEEATNKDGTRWRMGFKTPQNPPPKKNLSPRPKKKEQKRGKGGKGFFGGGGFLVGSFSLNKKKKKGVREIKIKNIVLKPGTPARNCYLSSITFSPSFSNKIRPSFKSFQPSFS